jgi:hypothetical protein
VLKPSALLVAAVALLQVSGCDAISGSSASDASSNSDEHEDKPLSDGVDGGTPVTDAGLEADAPTSRFPQVPALHRVSATACTQPRPPGNVAPCGIYFKADAGNCANDQDCTAGLNGRCNCDWPPSGGQCSYDACTSDSDCPGREVCDCRESPAHVTWGTQTVCLAGNCRTDSDCGPGGYCSPSPLPGCGAGSWYGYFCHTPGDQCVDDADCNQGNAYCAYDMSSSRWVCSTGMCIDG